MKLYKALKDIFDQYGTDMLEKETLVNFLADYRAYEVKATRRVMQTFLQMGYGSKVLQLDITDAPDKLLKIRSFASQ